MANVCLLAVSTVAMLSTLELAARMLGPSSDSGSQGDYVEHDPLLGWRKRPGAHVAFARGEYVINANGLRDGERGLAPTQALRVLALGDSFVEGMSVRFEDSVAQVLERLLTRPWCRVEVVNGGTVGYSTDQEYLFYVEHGWRYEPRVVLLFVYYNDVVYNGRADYAHRPKPLLAFHDGVPYLKNAPVPSPSSAQPAVAAAARSRSAALAWLGDRLQRSAPRSYDHVAALGLLPGPPPPADRPAAELGVYAANPPAEARAAWEHTVAILRALARAVTARQARLMLVYVPSKMEVRDADWQQTQARYGLRDGEWRRDALARRLEVAAAEIGVPALDLTPALRASERGLLGGPYHSDGGHWNALGHEVAANTLATALRAQGDWLAPCTPRR